MTGEEIRKKFIKYFGDREHSIIPSAPLVPQNDPTLMFTNAGMVQFKNIFLGQEKPPHPRAVTVQKCVRAGGKHNDLEMVGRTARHHTFFEMLGNFSFGDYFKEEAIAFAWEFLTKEIGLPENRLYASVYEEDDDAYKIWETSMGLPQERIYRMGEEDNFWSMGPTGPCGPCSEIYIDQGEALGCGKPECSVGCECDRYLEIWNLVFMQYDRDAAGKLSPLPKPCIDTGMGLERLTAVVQNQPSNYDCDLMMGIITSIAKVTGTPYDPKLESGVSQRVIADHARSAAFLISDGVLPSNEGRGYVLRRIMRRALRHGRLLGMEKPFFYKITDQVVTDFKPAYPDLDNNRSFIQKVVRHEEEGFINTLTYGTRMLDDILDKMKKNNQTTIPGEEVFKLYDTYGFPVDLVEETAKDTGTRLDMVGFNKAMKEQKTKAMASWKGSGEKTISPVYNQILEENGPTRFLGYENIQDEGRVIAILSDGKETGQLSAGEEGQLLFDQTPFYGESGGQVGDSGRATNEGLIVEILDSKKPVSKLIAHEVKVKQGNVRLGDILHLEVDKERRSNTMFNHTATHLLHAALKETLGNHIKQAGSLVAPDKLRFDFTHFTPLSPQERFRLEDLVNEKIRNNIPVQKDEMDIEQAIEEGAVALFGEKYGDRVRVVDVPGFSKELCGGTHVNATGEIGFFRIVQETGVASGVRRIEAVTGPISFQRIQKEFQDITSIRSMLKAPPDEEVARLEKLLIKQKEMEKEIASLKEKLVSGKSSGGSILDGVQKIGDVSLLVKKLESVDTKTLRGFIDNAKEQIKSGVVVAGGVDKGKVILAAGVTKDLTGSHHAGNILKNISAIVGGSGGGRPDMAQAGGTLPEKLDEALNAVKGLL
ncbi:MAG: alanine--tRNA ligase [Candidatus Nitronauta litoralis]|uniref:Alanine--tRNA ligase n=1 Tax=Candidatus Nitronauta litoralis TaxID=2705533 RepID=A0A7T0G1Z6_9BACT|nr:MAG: alanine--tRNA ligase [Candidatus Nitronauta litoralis]